MKRDFEHTIVPPELLGDVADDARIERGWLRLQDDLEFSTADQDDRRQSRHIGGYVPRWAFAAAAGVACFYAGWQLAPQQTTGPVTLAPAINDHARNVNDEVLRLTTKNGGVVMINFYSGFITPTEQLRNDSKDLGELSDVVDHIEHVIKVAGIDHVGIGSDYDGVPRLPAGLEDVSTYPRITQELLNRGHKREAIHKILGGNVMRVLREAENVADRLRKARPE